MENPTLERMEAWRDQATERLSLFARSNAIEEPIGIGEECYQLGVKPLPNLLPSYLCFFLIV